MSELMTFSLINKKVVTNDMQSVYIVGGGGGAVGNVVGGATGTPLLEGERDALVVERLCRAVHVPASQRALSATERHLGSRHPCLMISGRQ